VGTLVGSNGLGSGSGGGGGVDGVVLASAWSAAEDGRSGGRGSRHVVSCCAADGGGGSTAEEAADTLRGFYKWEMDALVLGRDTAGVSRATR
jgi:hypothetical protein